MGRGTAVFSVPMIPPNLTGDLHLGHGLMACVQDCQVRLRRRRGEEVHYVPGVDHAGIGMYAQVVAAADFRPDLPVRGRLLAWAARHREAIRAQLHALDLACEWDRETYTLEPRYNRLGRFAFGRLAEGGLLYRDRRVVWWCPSCRSTISDVECERRLDRRETALLPVQVGPRRVVVECREPELLPGAVAYLAPGPVPDVATATAGGRGPLPVVSDESVPGPGLLVPGHDPAHLAVARRLGLPVVEVLDGAGRSLLPETSGMGREELRRWVVERWGLRTVARQVETWHCSRCDGELTRRLTWQWFLRTRPLFDPLTRAIEAGEVRLLPGRITREAAEWLRQAGDWCISRQIPWGQRIPARVCRRCAGWTAGRLRHCPECGHPLDVERDVFDTWFTCSLWPIAAAGWPDPERLRRLYPMSMMTTGRDILFFLFVRALALDRYLTGVFPTATCYFHGLVVSADGTKMSKSRGNAVTIPQALAAHDPDVLRSALLSGCSGAHDVRLRDGLFTRARAIHGRLVDAACLAGEGALPAADGLTHWGVWMVREAGERVGQAVDRFAYAEAVRHLWTVSETVVARWLRARSAGAAGAAAAGPSDVALLGHLAGLFEPFMPRVAGRLALLAGGAGLDLDLARARAAGAYLDAVAELEGLRGAAGISTAQPVALSLPDGVARLLAGEGWLGPATRLDLTLGPAPAAGAVPWRSTRAEGAVLHLPPALRGRLRSEALRRLRLESDRMRRLRRGLALMEAGAPPAPLREGLLARRTAAAGRLEALRANVAALI